MAPGQFEYYFPASTRKFSAGFPMTEMRKMMLLLSETILAARKLAALDSDRPSPAKSTAVDRAIEQAKFILQRIDERWPDGSSR